MVDPFSGLLPRLWSLRFAFCALRIGWAPCRRPQGLPPSPRCHAPPRGPRFRALQPPPSRTRTQPTATNPWHDAISLTRVHAAPHIPHIKPAVCKS